MTTPRTTREPDGRARFELGRLITTPGVLDLIQAGVIHPGLLLRRHVKGDWGQADDHDRRANDTALADGDRLVSAYGHGGTRVWVVTEADRSVTTMLLPGEA
ncbi:MAG: hypothetical protein ACRDRS_13895 [Pseudonocardiaceae bacterium]